MSLANYKSLCIEKYKLANPDKDIPSNMGCKWTDAEEQELLDNIKNSYKNINLKIKFKNFKPLYSARI